MVGDRRATKIIMIECNEAVIFFAGSKTGTGSVRAQVSNSEFPVTDRLIRLSSINTNYPTFTMATGKKLAGPPF